MRWRKAIAAVLALVGTSAFAAPGPGPGQPFAGDDAGCVPSTTQRLSCAQGAARAFATFESAVANCHLRLANDRYSQVVLGRPPAFDEEACEATASGRYERAMSRAAAGSCAHSPIPGAAEGAALLAELDAQNGTVYCDATLAVGLDPGGDDPGFVPATANHRACAAKVTRNLKTLSRSARRCHRNAADLGFRLADPGFDEEACENRALAKFDAAAAHMASSGICPPCLDAASQHGLGLAAAARLDADNDVAYPCPDPVLHLGTPQLDRPTLMALGVQVPISGDENHDAVVAVRFRRVGDATWKDGLPLFRVRPETVPGRALFEQFAGSIFDLRPATDYEIELHATDVDGPVDETVTLVATTRSLPADPVSPHAVAVSDTAGLNAALAAAQAGDVITVADGVYAGPFVLDAGGTAADPIVVRGASRDGTILDGGGCDACNVLEVYGSFVHVERLTLRNANRGLRFQTGAAEANVARRLRIENTRLGFGAREDQVDFYVCDNLLEGRLVWPQVYTDDDGAHSNDDGILVQGNGHVVCHNQIRGYGDALKVEQTGARSLDFYGNEVLSAYDNGIELDLSEGNTRCLRNRFTNTYATLSFQPVYGGPAYALRNVVVNVAHEQMKFHGIGSATGPSGVLVYHNTFVSPGMALLLETSVASHFFDVRNNLFVGPAVLSGTRVADWLGPIDNGVFENDGWFPDGGFRFNLAPGGLVSFADFAALQAGGMETSGVLLTQPIFANGLTPPASYTATLAPADVTPAAGSEAIDAAAPLANLNDAHQGAAADLGAVERGCPQPIYGIRPEGIDESNEPLGCAP